MPFSLKEPIASSRYKDNFEEALYYAIGENEKKINDCGYKILVIKRYFENSDRIFSIRKDQLEYINLRIAEQYFI